MFVKKILVLTAALAVLGMPSRLLFAADDLGRVLRDLDKASASFHSTSADFEFDTYQTDPFPDKDVQKGTAYYERKAAVFSMAAHIQEVNGKPISKLYTFSDGQLKLDDVMSDQVITYKRASKFESYVMLGFGASGKELTDKWNVTYAGTETLDGVKTEKLELVAKDPTVRQNLPKVTVWLDTVRAISLKQVFDEGQGVSRVCVYFNIKLNQALPADAFKLKTDSKTQYQEQ
jgi:outer membrane lipoprotein-sorting protein